jgi:hypothetical protein
MMVAASWPVAVLGALVNQPVIRPKMSKRKPILCNRITSLSVRKTVGCNDSRKKRDEKLQAQ